MTTTQTSSQARNAIDRRIKKETKMENRNEYIVNRDGVQAVRIVTECKGSWRWQDAFRTAYYAIRPRVKRGKGKSTFVWTCIGRSGKYAKTHGRGDNLAAGTLHNRPVTADQLSSLVTLSEQYGAEIAVR